MPMKSSASLCLSDAVSIIAFKKCPISRLCLVTIIETAWMGKTFLKIWHSSVTVWPFSIYNIPDTWVNENIENEKTDVIENGCRFLLVVIFCNSVTKENVWL